MYALVDCNSFFASCERVFRPDLLTKPVLVLSNNDGCVIARSTEVKQLGIKMGEPFFKCRPIIKANGVHVFSSNFTLYGDFSNRVVATLRTFTPFLEVYSVDESFCHFTDKDYQPSLGDSIKARVLKWTGIPVSVGFGKTKTLAKLANQLAKNSPTGVVDIHDYDMQILGKYVPVSDVWGIGRQLTKKLQRYGVHTVKDFLNLDEKWVKTHLHMPGLRTYMELHGTACLGIELDTPNKKTILSSRTFGRALQSFAHLKGAVANNVSVAAEKLRRQNSVTTSITVFIATNRFKGDRHSVSYTIGIPVATDATNELIQSAMIALERIYMSNKQYNRSGVLLNVYTPNTAIQNHLFSPVTDRQLSNQKLMKAMDKINAKWGRFSLVVATGAIDNRPWKMNQKNRSPRYTTSWADLPLVNA